MMRNLLLIKLLSCDVNIVKMSSIDEVSVNIAVSMGDSDNKFSFPPPAPKMDIYTGEMLNK